MRVLQRCQQAHPQSSLPPTPRPGHPWGAGCLPGTAHPLWEEASVQFSHSVVSDSAIPWSTAHQASLSITNSQSLLKLMFIVLVMPSLAPNRGSWRDSPNLGPGTCPGGQPEARGSSWSWGGSSPQLLVFSTPNTHPPSTMDRTSTLVEAPAISIACRGRKKETSGKMISQQTTQTEHQAAGLLSHTLFSTRAVGLRPPLGSQTLAFKRGLSPQPGTSPLPRRELWKHLGL